MRQLNRRTAARRPRSRALGRTGRTGVALDLAGPSGMLARTRPESVVAGTVALLLLMLVAGFALGAARVGVHLSAWAALAGALVLVLAGLLYAFRLRAAGPRG